MLDGNSAAERNRVETHVPTSTEKNFEWDVLEEMLGNRDLIIEAINETGVILWLQDNILTLPNEQQSEIFDYLRSLPLFDEQVDKKRDAYIDEVRGVA